MSTETSASTPRNDRALDAFLGGERRISGAYADELSEKSRQDQNRTMLEREHAQNAQRNRLRDFSVQLREPHEHYAKAPASELLPAFKLGDTPNFYGAVENLTERPGMGHLSAPAHQEFLQHLRAASKAPDVHTRESHTQQAAQVVSRDYLSAKGLANMTGEDVRRGALHQMRSQIVMNMRSLGESVGLSGTTASVVAFSLERALEREGFTVLANRAIDSVANRASALAGAAKEASVRFASAAPDVYRASTASTSAATSMRHSMQQTLHNSMNAMKEMNVTRESLKGFMQQHMGKIMVMMEVAQNPHAFQRLAQVIAKSPDALNAVYNVATDRQLRQATGTLLVAAGESAGGKVWRGGAALAVVAGSAMRGDSVEKTGRHAFVAAMSIAGGALAATAFAAAGPLGMGAGGFLGAEAGAKLADVLLQYWDKWTARQAPTQQQNLVTQQEVRDSAQILLQRGGSFVQNYANHSLQGNQANVVSNWMPGQTSKQFESANGGAGAISSGKGDHGGASYGTYQLSSKMGTLGRFLSSSQYGAQFSGMRPATAKFDAKWKELARNDPGFAKAQHDFIKQTHYDPAMAGLKRIGLDFAHRGPAVQDAVWSTSVQFGSGNAGRGAIGLVSKALAGKDPASMSDKQIITAIQDYKLANNDRLFASSSERHRAGTANRAVAEKNSLLKLADQTALASNSPAAKQASLREAGREMELSYGRASKA